MFITKFLTFLVEWINEGELCLMVRNLTVLTSHLHGNTLHGIDAITTEEEDGNEDVRINLL